MSASPEPLDPVTQVDYLVGHAPDNDGQNPFGQDHVMDLLEAMHPDAVRAVAMEAICRLANPAHELGLDATRFIVTGTGTGVTEVLATARRQGAIEALAEAAANTHGLDD